MRYVYKKDTAMALEKTKHGRKAKPYRLKSIEILSSSHDIDQISNLAQVQNPSMKETHRNMN